MVPQANLCSHETEPSWHGDKFMGYPVTERHITKRGKVPAEEKFTGDSGGSWGDPEMDATRLLLEREDSVVEG